MADTFDLVILGAGTGGYSCALRAAGVGLSVALVEKDKEGGTCLHWGCIPTKAFLQASEVADHARTADQFGVRATFDGIDMPTVLKYKQGVVDANWKGLQATLKQRGVEVIKGTGRLKDPATVVVDTGEGERTVTAARGLVLATGSVPRGVPIPGADIDGQRVITSDHALFLDAPPQRPIVLGASAVGVEFATVFKAFGAEEVTIVEMLDGLVPREDLDTQKALARDFRRSGYKAMVSTRAKNVEHGADGVRVTVEDANGEESTLEGDVVMIAVGRAPVTSDMGFEDVGVKVDRGYVMVDEYCRTGAGNGGATMYAIGDILPPPSLGLAHASFSEGFLVAEHAAGQRVAPIDYLGVPRVYYCHPEIGSVGMTEQECQQAGLDYEKRMFPYSHNARAMMMKGSGHVKVLAEKNNGRVLGVHIVGQHATDLIAEGQMIYNWEALPSDVAQFIHPHPTLSEAIGEAHMALAGKPLHG